MKGEDIKDKNWDERYAKYTAYREAIDQLVLELDEAFKNETDPEEKEDIRSYLNYYYQTQFALEHNLI